VNWISWELVEVSTTVGEIARLRSWGGVVSLTAAVTGMLIAMNNAAVGRCKVDFIGFLCGLSKYDALPGSAETR
jgi:hypothetical protein